MPSRWSRRPSKRSALRLPPGRPQSTHSPDSTHLQTMRIATGLLLSTLVGSASAFGVHPTFKSTSRSITSLNEAVEVELTAEQIEMKAKCERWGAIKVLSEEDARAQLEGEELQSYLDYHQHIAEDIERMKAIAEMMVKDMDKKKEIKPKTKGQRKRDKWAKVQARMAAGSSN